jgi:signal transduction histidine kinase
MTYPWIIPLIAAVASLMLGVLVERSGARTELRQVFAFTAVALAFWNLIYVVLYSVSDYNLAFQLSRVMRSGAIFMFPGILHLAIAAPERPRSRWVWKVLVADYTFFGLLVVANAFDLVVTHLRMVQWGYYSVGTSLYNIFTVMVFVNFTTVLMLLAYEYRTTLEPRMRLQLKFWLFGMGVALPLGLTNLLPVYGVPIYPLGNLGSAAWAGIVAYAIVRHRLMDIEVVISKGIAYLGVTVLLVGPAFLIAIAMERFAFGEVHYDFSAGLLALLLAMGVLFPIVRARAEARVERSLFPEKQEIRATLDGFARSVIRILDRERLSRELCEALREGLRLDDVALFLAEDLRGRYEVRRIVGRAPVVTGLNAEDQFIHLLNRRGEPVLRDELGDDRSAQVDSARAEAVFRSNGWEVCVPLMSGSLLVGFVGLGKKRDLQAFVAGDFDLLANVAAQAAIAFENARLYEELRRSRDIINRAGRLSALGTLAAGIAHEIRNPLVSIQTFFQLAPQRLADEEFMTSFLKLAETEVQRISSLISELLSFAKSPTASVGEVDLDELVDRTVTLLAPQARAQQIRLERMVPRTRCIILADRDQIMQVLINIVLNGIQATSRDGAVLVETREVDYENGRFCQVEIRDTGAGIPQEMREAIFNPFFTTKDKGTGLGLPIAHRIVVESGGFITVESVEGQGSQFVINLPATGQSSDENLDQAAVGRLQG